MRLFSWLNLFCCCCWCCCGFFGTIKEKRHFNNVTLILIYFAVIQWSLLNLPLSPNITHCSFLWTQSGSWLRDYNPSMNISSKLGAPVDWALSYVAVPGLGNNITLGKNSTPDIQFCYNPNESLVCHKASSNFVLILSNDGGTSRGNFATHIHVSSFAHRHPIFVELIISILAAPCKADMVPFAVI